MFSHKFVQRTRWSISTLCALAILILATPAFAQTGRIQGKVLDPAGKPVADVKIIVTEIPNNGGQKWEGKSDKNGNYIIGTIPKSGAYLVRAEKSGVGVDEQRATVKLGDFTNLNFNLSNKPLVSEEQAAKNQSIKKFFEDGVAAANANNHEVVAGPVEATAAGNILIQAIALGQVESLSALRQIVSNSFPLNTVQPVDSTNWQDAYRRFAQLKLAT